MTLVKPVSAPSFTIGQRQLPSQQPTRTSVPMTPKQRQTALNELSRHPLYANNTKIWDDDNALHGAVSHMLKMPNPDKRVSDMQIALQNGGWNMNSFPAPSPAAAAQRPVPKPKPVAMPQNIANASPCGPGGCPVPGQMKPPVARTPSGTPRLVPGAPPKPLAPATRPKMTQMPPKTAKVDFTQFAPKPKVAPPATVKPKPLPRVSPKFPPVDAKVPPLK
jgi:hypothetical protein